MSRLNYRQLQPNKTGVRREPCRTIGEVADALGITQADAKSLRSKYGIQATGMGSKWTHRRTYHLTDFQQAINLEKGETVYVVHKDVPLPPVHSKRDTIYAKPIAAVLALEVGSMIELPEDVARNVMHIIRREHQMMTFATRQRPNEMRGIWRLL